MNKNDQSEFGNKVTKLTVMKDALIHFWGGSGWRMIIRVTNSYCNDFFKLLEGSKFLKEGGYNSLWIGLTAV